MTLNKITTSLLSSSALVFALSLGLSSPAQAAQELAPGLTLDSELKFQGAWEDNMDLGTAGDQSEGLGAAEAKFRVTKTFTPDLLFLWEGRAVGLKGDAGYQDTTTGNVADKGSFLEWRQSYFQFSNVGGNAPLNIKVGRQRIWEPYGLWWNDRLDAVSVDYDTTTFKGSLTGGQDFFSYRTGNYEFKRDDRDIARLLAEGSWQYYYQNFIEARAAYESDHSGIHIGDAQDPNDPDSREGHFYWAGVRATGETQFLTDKEDNKLMYRVDLMGVRGRETLPTVAGSTITATNSQDVAGWALDAGVDVPLAKAAPLVHLGYAYGSGDDNAGSGTDHTFRQTGVDGNFSQIGALTQNTNNYGTVLRPELGNIHIFTAGLTSKVFRASDTGVLYRYYRLAENAGSLSSGGVTTTLGGGSKSLGQGVDLLFNTDILKEADLNIGHVQDLSLRSSLGFFRSGDAFGAAKGETAVRGLVEVKVGF